MTSYFLRRLLLIIPTLLGVTLLVFTITRFVPGGPIERMITELQRQAVDGGGGAGRDAAMASMGETGLSSEQLEQLREYYGFNEPVLKSYGLWLGKVMQGNLGESTRYNDPVWEMIKSRVPVSLFFGLISMFLIYSICIPLGILKAIKHKTSIDNITSIVVFVGYAIPGYIVAVILLLLLAGKWGIFPLGGMVSDQFPDLSSGAKVRDLLWHMTLPVTAYVAGSFAMMTFMMKNSLMDNLAKDYVRTAMAKGMSFRRAVFKHAFRNSLIPIATSFGNNLSVVLAGSFLIEKIFNIDGMGLLGYESIMDRDYPVVMGILLISALLQLLGNIVSDVCVAFVDPRVQFK